MWVGLTFWVRFLFFLNFLCESPYVFEEDAVQILNRSKNSWPRNHWASHEITSTFCALWLLLPQMCSMLLISCITACGNSSEMILNFLARLPILLKVPPEHGGAHATSCSTVSGRLWQPVQLVLAASLGVTREKVNCPARRRCFNSYSEAACPYTCFLQRYSWTAKGCSRGSWSSWEPQ